MKVINHGCTLDCPDCCKFKVYVKDGQVKKIEGDRSHPYTKGFICHKGRGHLAKLYHPYRITTPLKKANDQWEAISFDEAIDLMAEKLHAYKEQFSPQSILYHEQFGSGSLLKSCGDLFFNFFGGASKAIGGPCWSAGMDAQKYDFGVAKSHALEDMLNSKSIILWGKNPAETSIHTIHMLLAAKDKGIPIVVIDPIFTPTAKHADLYVAIKPGTDDALALAMAKVIVDSNLHNQEYIQHHVVGFEQYNELLHSLSLDILCQECGVSSDTVLELVRLYTQQYSTIWLGYGLQKYYHGGNAIRHIDALGAITGQIGQIGGGVNYANEVYPGVLNTDPYQSTQYGTTRTFYLNKMSQFITESLATETPVKMAVIAKSNLLTQMADLNALTDAFDQIEFKVCFDLFLTDTAMHCDLFIPCTNTLESEDLLYSSMCNPYITFKKKAVDPTHPLMDEYSFFLELAKKLQMAHYPYVSKKEYLTNVIAPLKTFDSTITLERLNEEYFTIDQPIPWSDQQFETPSGKYEIYSERAKQHGVSPLPTYQPLAANPAHYPFRLLTVHSRESLSSQQFMDYEGIASCYINGKMAEQFGIVQEQTVTLRSPYGEIEVVALIDEGVSDQVVKMYVGWWEHHGNPNYLTDSGSSDMGGQVTYNETFVMIEPIQQ